MAENIFNEKQDYIVAARDEVIKRDEYAANIDRMKQQQKKLSRSIASEEKSIADEIATTIKKRRQDIQSTYDDRLDDNRARKKKVANKRDKKKEERMDKRYHEETKSLRESDKDLKVEMQTLLRKYKLPSFCGKKLYFALFYAERAGGTGCVYQCPDYGGASFHNGNTYYYNGRHLVGSGEQHSGTGRCAAGQQRFERD